MCVRACVWISGLLHVLVELFRGLLNKPLRNLPAAYATFSGWPHIATVWASVSVCTSPACKQMLLSQLTRSQSDHQPNWRGSADAGFSDTCVGIVCVVIVAAGGIACCCWHWGCPPGVPLSAPVELALPPASARPTHSTPAGRYQERPCRERTQVSRDRGIQKEREKEKRGSERGGALCKCWQHTDMYRKKKRCFITLT